MPRVDLDHGGRWTDLTLAGRQWLWHRPDPARAQVRPGGPFVDAGGLEECLPTVRGVPDHGTVWSRPWVDLGGGAAAVETEDFRLERRINSAPESVRASYRLMASPGYRFVWAAHALLDVSDAATLSIPDGTSVRMYDVAPERVSSTWPECGGVPMWRLGPNDGSAVGAVCVGASTATVVDGDHDLELTLQCEQAPVSMAIWRNLGGFPDGAPYRSIGVEPMLGSVFDIAEAEGPDDAATVPGSGELTWQLELRGRAT